MESGSLQAVAECCPATVGTRRQPPQFPVRTPGSGPAVPARPECGVPPPGQPAAVVVAGAQRHQRRALLAAVLGPAASVPQVPAPSFLVLRHGPAQEPVAFLPGCRAPRPMGGTGGSPLARSPRRIELSVPEPFLRYVQPVDAPDTEFLGVPGNQVLLDTVDRAGALLYLLAAGQPPTPADLDLLVEVADRKAAVFVAVPVGSEAARAAVLAAVPALRAATWCTVDLDTGEAADLRRTLVEWAGLQELSRADGDPAGGRRVAPARLGSHRTIRVLPGAHESGWADRLTGLVRESDRRMRERLAADLTELHQRCSRTITGPAGCAALPDLLDREVHALSVRAAAGRAAAVASILEASAVQVLAADPEESVRRVAAAVRWALVDDPDATELDRVLLVTTTGGVATVTGAGAVAALDAWSGPADRAAVLPPLGVGLAGGCYLHWRKPGNADPERARAWLARVVSAVEQALAAELSRRLEVVRRSLAAVLADAVDHGILLA